MKFGATSMLFLGPLTYSHPGQPQRFLDPGFDLATESRSIPSNHGPKRLRPGSLRERLLAAEFFGGREGVQS